MFLFTSFSQSPYPPAYACYLAGIPLRVGQSREFGGSLLTHWVRPPGDEAHQVDRNLHLVRSVGIPAADTSLGLRVPDDAQEAAEALLARAGVEPGRPFAVMAPGASCQARTYPPDRFGRVARLLGAAVDLPVVLVGTERERGLERALTAAAGPGLRSLVGRTTVPQLAAVISRSALVVCSHSGPMHLADAFLRPTVVLFSGTDLESQWRPRHAPATVLRRPTWCSPCYAFRCPYDLECLDVAPDEVVEAAGEVMAAADGPAGTRPVPAGIAGGEA